MAKGEKTKQKAVRNHYSEEQKAKAQKLYFKGLSVVEIADLLNIEFATVKKWRSVGKWVFIKENTIINKKAEAIRLNKEGFRKNEIAKKLNLSTATIYRYLHNGSEKGI